jgi:hypothetical protein
MNDTDENNDQSIKDAYNEILQYYLYMIEYYQKMIFVS